MIKTLLSKIKIPKGKIFFDYFDNSTKACCESTAILSEIIQSELTDNHIYLAKELRNISDDWTKKTLLFLNNTYMTLIDREDVQQIAVTLNKVTKRIIRTILTFRPYQLSEYTDDLKKQVVILSEAVVALQQIIFKFRNFKRIDEMTEIYEHMKIIESKGDEIFYHAMTDLFSGKYDALTVIKLKDIYGLIENALDRCFHLSELLVNVSLKHT